MIYPGLYGKHISKPQMFCALHQCYIDVYGMRKKQYRCMKCKHARELTYNEKRGVDIIGKNKN